MKEKIADLSQMELEVFHTIGQPILILHPNHTIMAANPAAEKLTGLRQKDLLGKKCFSVFHGTNTCPDTCPLPRLKHSGGVETVQMEIAIAEGLFSITCSPVFGEDGHLSKIIHVMTDLTDKQRSDQRLKQQDRFIKEVFDSIQDGISILDTKLNIVLTNKTMEKWYAHQLPLKGKKCFEAYHGTNRRCAVCPSSDTLKNGKPSYSVVGLTGEGGKTVGWLDLFSFPLKDSDDGKVTGVIEYVRDITERKLAEDALSKSEERFRVLSDGTFEAIVIHDNGIILQANSQYYDMFGYTPEELRGKDALSMTISPEAISLAKKRVDSGDLGPYEIMGVKKDGTEFPLQIRVRIMEYEGRSVRMAAIRDMSGQKRAEAEKERLQTQLQRAEKMEAIGTLAGGVAHDLNNILSGIVSYPDLMLMDLPMDSPLREPLKTIKTSGEKAAAIVQDLLTLARRGVAVMKVTDLNRIVHEYLKSSEFKRLKAYYPNTQIKSRLESDLLPILASSVHLSNTIMNLVSNAAEATSGKGLITISTENQYIDTPIKGYDKVKEGDYVVLSVADDGVGISPADMEKVFEPFYTKKSMGRSGTGLGMAVVWGTVKDHHGYIDIASTEGKGSIFKLYFPVTRKKEEEKEVISTEVYTGNGETILVVDDIEEQRDIATTLLTRLGYRVDVAPSGEDAVDYVKNKAPDLVILDMIMAPGLDGLETYRQILEWRPHQKAIIASGFSETDRVKEAQRLGAGAYVKKPYTLEKIGMAVQAELVRKEPEGP